MSSGGQESRGPATLRTGRDAFAVDVRMPARFEPVEGRFRWAGRTGPGRAPHERVSSGLRTAVLVIGNDETPVRLSEPGPWGGVRVSGTGTPPWFGRIDG